MSQSPEDASEPINQQAWRSRRARRRYGTASDWTDPGEAAAMAWLAEEVRGQPILDVGVGGVRTVPLLRALSDDYTAVDYMPEMVDLCRRNHPGVRVRRWTPVTCRGSPTAASRW